MGIALFSFNGLLARMQSLMGWLAQGPGGAAARSDRRPTEAHTTTARSCSSWSALPGTCRDRPRRPLRVVRVLESCQAASGAGRMVISGRMADVCAELDRLAALESAAG
jgi:hypothetical protein